jgi:RNA polymerase-binding transcription factor DksA
MKSDDLHKYREQLNLLRERLIDELRGLIAAVPEASNPAAERSSAPTHLADHVSEGLEAEFAIVHNEEGLLESVDAALERIDGGTYGTCTSCHTSIPAARLNAIPYSPFCVNCAAQAAPR